MCITNEDIFKLIKEGNEVIKKEICDLRADITADIANLKLRNEELENENKQLKNKILELERRSKKYNLVIYGVQGIELNTTEEVLKTINNKLNVACTKNDFRDIYRVGQSIEGKYRPVVAELLSYKLKADILTNARLKTKELKDHHIYFAQDLTKEDYQKRKFLNQQLKEARQKQYNAILKKDILIVDGEEYTYESLKEKEKNTTAITNSVNATPFEQVEVARNTSSEPATPTSDYTEKVFDYATTTTKRKLEDSPSKPTGAKPKITTRAQKIRTNAVPIL